MDEKNLINSENEHIEALETEEIEALSDRVKIISPGKLVAKRFFRSKLSIIGLVTIIFLFCFSFFGPPLLKAFGYKWGEIDIDSEKARVHYTQSKFAYDDGNGDRIEGYVVYITSKGMNIYAPPGGDHFLGTDDLAQDAFIRLMYGGRISLSISFIVIFLEGILGILLGGLAGYFGKWVDQVVMRVVDILYCIPSLPIMLIVGAMIGGWVDKEVIPESARIYVLMIIITLLGWAGIARMVRGQILSLREQEFMIAAEALGLSVPRKIFRHLLPNVLPQLIVSLTLGLGSVILSESTLSYLGLGVQAPYAAWGTMISQAKDPVVLEYYFNLWAPPGLLIILAVLGFNFVGDGLRDAFDPKMKR